MSEPYENWFTRCIYADVRTRDSTSLFSPGPVRRPRPRRAVRIREIAPRFSSCHQPNSRSASGSSSRHSRQIFTRATISRSGANEGGRRRVLPHPLPLRSFAASARGSAGLPRGIPERVARHRPRNSVVPPASGFIGRVSPWRAGARERWRKITALFAALAIRKFVRVGARERVREQSPLGAFDRSIRDSRARFTPKRPSGENMRARARVFARVRVTYPGGVHGVFSYVHRRIDRRAGRKKSYGGSSSW